MKRKSIFILAIISVLGISTLFSGCGQSNLNKVTTEGKDTSDKVKENSNKSGEAVKEGTESAKNGIQEAGDAVKYTATNVKDDIKKSGRELKDTTDSKKTYFKGTETDYLAGNDVVRIYEYDSSDTIESDVKAISSDGMTINGTTPGFKNKPFYYRKGNTLIMYEGNDSAYINEFNKLYNKPIA